jgi:hypothetical protein
MAGWRRSELKAGVYDEIVSARLDRQLAALGAPFEVYRSALTVSEPIGAVLESLLGDGLALALAELKADSAKGLALAEALLAVLHSHAPRVFERDDELRLNAERLTAIVARPAQAPERPRGSLHASSLIVNAEGDQLLEHLRSEFDSADSVDLLCAFIKLSGFEKFRTEIERHCDGRGRSLRVLTTTYMGASDVLAIERLAALPNATVKISYDENTTRLHAKAWIFHRASGFPTAFVGFIEPLACRSNRRSRMERSHDSVGSTSVGRADAGDFRPVLGGCTSVRTVRAWERRAARAAHESPLAGRPLRFERRSVVRNRAEGLPEASA